MNVRCMRTLSYLQPILLVFALSLLIIALVSENWIANNTTAVRNLQTVKVTQEFGLWTSCDLENGARRYCTDTSKFTAFSKFTDDQIKVWLILSACLQFLAVILSFCIALINHSIATILSALFCGTSITGAFCCICGLIVFGVRVDQSNFTDYEYQYAFVVAWIAAILLVVLSFFAYIFVRAVRSQSKQYTTTTPQATSVNRGLALPPEEAMDYEKPPKYGQRSFNSEVADHTMIILDDDENAPSSTNGTLSTFGKIDDKVDGGNLQNNDQESGSESDVDSYESMNQAPLKLSLSLVGHISIKGEDETENVSPKPLGKSLSVVGSYSLVEPDIDEDSSKKEEIDIHSDTDSTAEVLREYDSVIALMEEEVAKEASATENKDKLDAGKAESETTIRLQPS